MYTWHLIHTDCAIFQKRSSFVESMCWVSCKGIVYYLQETITMMRMWWKIWQEQRIVWMNSFNIPSNKFWIRGICVHCHFKIPQFFGNMIMLWDYTPSLISCYWMKAPAGVSVIAFTIGYWVLCRIWYVSYVFQRKVFLCVFTAWFSFFKTKKSNHALRLYPVPDILILNESTTKQYSEKYENDVEVMNTGPFYVDYKFLG